jgi:hypothetical protein
MTADKPKKKIYHKEKYDPLLSSADVDSMIREYNATMKKEEQK